MFFGQAFSFPLSILVKSSEIGFYEAIGGYNGSYLETRHQQVHFTNFVQKNISFTSPLTVTSRKTLFRGAIVDKIGDQETGKLIIGQMLQHLESEDTFSAFINRPVFFFFSIASVLCSSLFFLSFKFIDSF